MSKKTRYKMKAKKLKKKYVQSLLKFKRWRRQIKNRNNDVILLLLLSLLLLLLLVVCVDFWFWIFRFSILFDFLLFYLLLRHVSNCLLNLKSRDKCNFMYRLLLNVSDNETWDQQNNEAVYTLNWELWNNY